MDGLFSRKCSYERSLHPRYAVKHFSGQAVTSMIVTLFKALKMQKQLQRIYSREFAKYDEIEEI